MGHQVDSSAIVAAGECAIDFAIELLEELDRLDIFLPAIFVGYPLALLAAVVEIEHRRDGVDAQAVDVEFVQPEDGAGYEEDADLVAAVIEDAVFQSG